MKITPEMLRDAGACVDHLDIFTTEWPDGAEVTLANCLRAAELGLNLGWADRLLPPLSQAQFNFKREPHWAMFWRKFGPIRAEYLRQREMIRADYLRQREMIRADCHLLEAEYERRSAPFRAEYVLQCASVFFAIASKL